MTELQSQVLASLKDFQRTTVDYAFRRLWTDSDCTKKFLVADEVGLGKTMVAKGVIAKTVEHLAPTTKRIDIIYICSNSQIARQNLSRLNVVGGAEFLHADRLTLLPQVMKDLDRQQVNFLSFTPGTSLKLGNRPGRLPERVMLYWMLAEAWGPEFTRKPRWIKFFSASAAESSFRFSRDTFDRSTLDVELCRTLGREIDAAAGPWGGPLREELEECAQQFVRATKAERQARNWRRNTLIGVLRRLIARSVIEHLEPDLVILDEFQRFKDVLDGDDDAAQLARELFDHQDARVLLLSATPFKMYTSVRGDEDDHYRDFTRTVSFLAGPERAARVARGLRTMRDHVSLGSDATAARDARQQVQDELRRVMCRTERLSSTDDGDGMVADRSGPSRLVTAQDLRSWVTFDRIARRLESRDPLEYWKASPYPLNLMDRHGYQVRSKFHAAADANDPDIRALLNGGDGLLNWEDVCAYSKVDPGNAKLRSLMEDVLDQGAWRLAWIPPALPYYQLGGSYADPLASKFTKRLVFSAWNVVPKAIACMVSYEAERRAVEASGYSDRRYDADPLKPLLTYGRGAVGRATFALIYPSEVLARVGDPLAIARDRAGDPAPTLEDALKAVRLRLQPLVDGLPAPAEETPRADQRWYWLAPILLDVAHGEGDLQGLLKGFIGAASRRLDDEDVEDDDGPDDTRPDDDGQFADETDQRGGLRPLVSRAQAVAASDLTLIAGQMRLGSMPQDLVDVLAVVAAASPGVCSLRALSRVAGGEGVLAATEVRLSALRVASGLRSLFNRPELIPLLRTTGDERDEAYWRAVLDHCAYGGLQAVLDEYAHVLIESEGLQDAAPLERAGRVSDTMARALAVRAAPIVVEDIRVAGGAIELDQRRMNGHFASRYGRQQSDETGADRDEVTRIAYNSPFRPFVLASTSVGQEGLDFHTYSHAVVHWNLPSNPVDLEQREGRVHRYKGHAVRKNVASVHAAAAFAGSGVDPWSDLFDAAERERPEGTSHIVPFWVYPQPGGAVIERHVPALPLSREIAQYQRLQHALVRYRLVLGQPRQEDLIASMSGDVNWLRIDLAPPV